MKTVSVNAMENVKNVNAKKNGHKMQHMKKLQFQRIYLMVHNIKGVVYFKYDRKINDDVSGNLASPSWLESI